jgi:hypothetical protein
LRAALNAFALPYAFFAVTEQRTFLPRTDLVTLSFDLLDERLLRPTFHPNL